jgi:hypothetical protein
VHAYFKLYGCGEKRLVINADNCTGQNKNKTLLWYLMWRVMTGLHDSITYSFMIPGHTKFSPDGFFGLFKHKLRHSDVNCVDDIAEVVKQSSPAGHNLPQLVFNGNEQKVHFYQWTRFLGKYFADTKGSSKYQHFIFENGCNSVIKVHKSADAVAEHLSIAKKTQGTIPREDQLVSAGLQTLEAKGLSDARQWQLHDNIRRFVSCPALQDVVCPKPTCPRPKKTKIS